MALEAGLTSAVPAPAGAAFKTFAHDLELTLYLLAARLRGSAVALESLPNLRDDHNRLAGADTGLMIETDRMVNSLNTLADQIFRWSRFGWQTKASAPR
jgi:hypothetical protein